MGLVDSLLETKTFTKLGVWNTYESLRAAKGNNSKMAFVFRVGLFSQMKITFEPTGAPGHFLYFIHDILLGIIGKYKAAPLDDILGYRGKGVDHNQAVVEILEILSKHNLWLKPEKFTRIRSKIDNWAVASLKIQHIWTW